MHLIKSDNANTSSNDDSVMYVHVHGVLRGQCKYGGSEKFAADAHKCAILFLLQLHQGNTDWTTDTED